MNISTLLTFCRNQNKYLFSKQPVFLGIPSNIIEYRVIISPEYMRFLLKYLDIFCNFLPTMDVSGLESQLLSPAH
jgi:hypothetical protein